MPVDPDLASPSSTGLQPTTAAMLAYLAWWVTGLLFLMLEKENRYVRFHALQSVVGLGALWALAVGLWLVSFLSLILTYTLFYLLTVLALGVGVAASIVWLILLIKALRGERWELPLAGEIAKRYA